MVRFASAMGAAAVVILVLAAARAQAADLVPLKHGIYVSKDLGCEETANAVTISYDGGALWAGKGGACHSSIVNKTDKIYIVKTDCPHAEAGSGTSPSETFVLEKQKANTFRLISRTSLNMPGGPVVFKWCSAIPSK